MDEAAGSQASESALENELEEVDTQLRALLQQRAGLVARLLKDYSSSESAPASASPTALSDAQATPLATPQAASGPAVSGKILAADSVVLQQIQRSGADGPLSADALTRIYREVLSECSAQWHTPKIAYLGPQGTYTQSAAHKHFGKQADTRPYAGIDDVFRAVEIGECQFGVVPVENSIEGTINRTLDRITESPLRVCGEVRLRIEHNLLSHAESLADISIVQAHPQALAQCRHWLEANLPGVPREGASSNAAAAKLAVQKNTIAAIAGSHAAELYQLPVLSSNIEDEPSNTTRFMVIGDLDVEPTGNDATSLLVSAPHHPGGLRKMLEPFELAGVSMTRIESRPAKTALWNYVFFIDVSGHQNDSDLVPALQALARETRFFRVLGSYPQAVN